MEDDGIFLFKNSKAKVTELKSAEANEPSIVATGTRQWIDRIKYPFLGEAVKVVSAEQLEREGRVHLSSSADASALSQEQLKLLKMKRRTKSNRRHKKRTRRQRLLKQKLKNKS